MKKVFLFFVSLILLVALAGCGTGGAFYSTNVTNIELSEPNFKYVARDLEGSATQGYLLGISYTDGGSVGTFAIIKVTGTNKLYDEAIKNLWDNFRQKYGETDGKNLSLVNIRHDTEVLNTLVYTQSWYYITADVIEFMEE